MAEIKFGDHVAICVGHWLMFYSFLLLFDRQGTTSRWLKNVSQFSKRLTCIIILLVTAAFMYVWLLLCGRGEFPFTPRRCVMHNSLHMCNLMASMSRWHLEPNGLKKSERYLSQFSHILNVWAPQYLQQNAHW